MSTYVHTIYTAIITFPFLAALITFPLLLWNYRRYGAVSKWYTFIIYTFVFYMMTAYFMTILPLPTKTFVAHLTTPKYNLRPFVFILEFIKFNPFSITHPTTWLAALKAPIFIQPAFNILLTAPFGFYLRYFFKRNAKQTLLVGFLLSLFFELTQLSGLYGIYPRPYRLFDVDDLILNTTGAMLGYWLTGYIIKFLPTSEMIKTKTHAKSETVSIFRRITALIIDMFLWLVVASILDLIPGIGKSWLSSGISFLLVILLPEFFAKQTFGMKLVRMKLIDKSGGKPSVWKIIIRNLFSYGVIGGLLFIELYLLQMTAYVQASKLRSINFIIFGISFLFLPILIDFLIDSFARKYRLVYERISGTDTIGIKK